MKNLLSYLVLSGLSMFHLGVAKNDNWNNRPLLKGFSSQQEQNVSQVNTNNQESNHKSINKKKNVVTWYKKPSAKYAAGAVISLALTGYAFLQYMRSEVNLVAEDKIEEGSPEALNSNNGKVAEGSDSSDAQPVKKPISNKDKDTASVEPKEQAADDSKTNNNGVNDKSDAGQVKEKKLDVPDNQSELNDAQEEKVDSAKEALSALAAVGTAGALILAIAYQMTP